MKNVIACLFASVLMLSCSGHNTEVPDVNVETGTNDFELSYWIDMDLRGRHLRGYWFNTDDQRYPAIEKTPDSEIQNATKMLKETYYGNKLYVIYHRQYEPDVAKEVFLSWKKHCDTYGLEMVPCIVLESYYTDPKMNFTDNEIISLCQWSLDNINKNEFAIYDVWVRDQAGSPQDIQISKIRESCGDVLVKVGAQPVLALNDYFKYAVQDCWTAECQGRTNELWEHPVYYNGSYDYGRNLLEIWVKDRVVNDDRRWAFCLIPVAWDYDVNLDKPSYDCPGDDALTNDPPVEGRVKLCADYIVSWYESGVNNPKFGGFSCDLHILQANSAGCRKDYTDYYTALRTQVEYNGYFSKAIKEIAEIYKSLND